MKRGGAGIDYIRKTVFKCDVTTTLMSLESRAERLTIRAESAWTGFRADVLLARAAALREAIDTIERDLGLMDGHPTRGWGPRDRSF